LQHVERVFRMYYPLDKQELVVPSGELHINYSIQPSTFNVRRILEIF